jgi:hypothetical protein
MFTLSTRQIFSDILRNTIKDNSVPKEVDTTTVYTTTTVCTSCLTPMINVQAFYQIMSSLKNIKYSESMFAFYRSGVKRRLCCRVFFPRQTDLLSKTDNAVYNTDSVFDFPVANTYTLRTDNTDRVYQNKEATHINSTDLNAIMDRFKPKMLDA